ncbi:MAG: gamma carbonic anhydrase family protein [Calditrichia bacterium]
MIEEFLNKEPKIHPTVFVEETAKIIGDVEIGEFSSIWFYSVIRGDVNFIRIGSRTNIQDGSILHVTFKKFPLIIGNNVTVGHGALIHGCTIKDNALIGMGATILDNATINRNSFIAAGALVKEGFVVPEGTLVAGVPARVIRELNESEIKKIELSATNYVNYAADYVKILHNRRK